MNRSAVLLLIYILALICVAISMIPLSQLAAALPAAQVLGVVLLTHVPAILPVRQQVKLMGGTATWFGGFPEAPIPLLVWLAWALAGGATTQSMLMFAFGGCVALCLGVAYAAVRLVDRQSARAGLQASANPTIDLAPLRNTGARFIYALRVILVLSSAVAIIAVLATNTSGLWGVAVCVVCALGAGVLAFTTTAQLRDIAKAGEADAAHQVELAQQANPATVVIHYSQSAKSKHLPPRAIGKKLRSEAITTAMLFRELAVQQTAKDWEVDYLWSAPTITHLDAFALDTVRAVFYTNDGIKNGHFTRFNQYVHVLDPQNGVLGKTPELPAAVAIYDAIVAPSLLVAEKWRAAADAAIASKVVTVGSLDLETTLFPAMRRCPDRPRISLHVHSRDLDPATFGAFMDDLLALLADVAATPELEFIFCYSRDVPSHLLDLLVAECTRQAANINGMLVDEKERVVIQECGPATGHNTADVLIATQHADVVQMLATQKIILWMGQGVAPAGTLQIGLKHGSWRTQLDAQIKRAVTPKFVMPKVPQHYPSYSALLDDLVEARKLVGTSRT